MALSFPSRAAFLLAMSSLLVSVGGPSAAQNSNPVSLTATVEGSKQSVKTARSDDVLLLNAVDLAIALGQEAKVVSNGRLLTFCQTGDDGLCIPVSLRDVQSTGKGESLFVDAKVLARALRLEIDDQKTQIVIRRSTGKLNDEANIPAFNTAWGEGRGFRPGQTLPDIPLMGMDGQEVRFSHFLGKRYIIYCWASW